MLDQSKPWSRYLNVFDQPLPRPCLLEAHAFSAADAFTLETLKFLCTHVSFLVAGLALYHTRTHSHLLRTAQLQKRTIVEKRDSFLSHGTDRHVLYFELFCICFINTQLPSFHNGILPAAEYTHRLRVFVYFTTQHFIYIYIYMNMCVCV